jgi:hypothetical protein
MLFKRKHKKIKFHELVGSPAKAGQAIIPLNSKLFYDEKDY